MKIKNPIMTLITERQYKELCDAGYHGMTPIVKLFVANLTWLITGIEEGILYGYADIGFGCVEWGSLDHVGNLADFRCRGVYLERDRYFEHVDGTKYLGMESLVGI